MGSYYEIRLSGSGGQGMMLAGSFLAEAAGIYDDMYVVQTRSYGPESRGGASRSEIIISSEPIVYPEVRTPDLVLAMTQEASDKYHSDLKADGIMIIDADLVKNKPATSARFYEIPMTRIAREEVGREITANVVALGALASLVDWVSSESLKKVILERAPKGTEEMNEKAFAAGYQAAKGLL
jgi:2-oxoglutarate ferredoxin oxidoreductase subunit gamma